MCARPAAITRACAKLNERFRQAGKPQMKLTVPDELEDEDMMEMVSAGLLRVIVVDD